MLRNTFSCSIYREIFFAVIPTRRTTDMYEYIVCIPHAYIINVYLKLFGAHFQRCSVKYKTRR